VAARASTVGAPAGACTLAPTASILPLRMTIVPRSMTGPATVWIVAFVIAQTAGAGFCTPSGVVPPLTLVDVVGPWAVIASPSPSAWS
jgi:hypothetical protein